MSSSKLVLKYFVKIVRRTEVRWYCFNWGYLVQYPPMDCWDRANVGDWTLLIAGIDSLSFSSINLPGWYSVKCEPGSIWFCEFAINKVSLWCLPRVGRGENSWVTTWATNQCRYNRVKNFRLRKFVNIVNEKTQEDLFVSVSVNYSASLVRVVTVLVLS